MVSDFLPVISLPRFHICIDFVKTFLERHIEGVLAPGLHSFQTRFYKVLLLQTSRELDWVGLDCRLWNGARACVVTNCRLSSQYWRSVSLCKCSRCCSTPYVSVRIRSCFSRLQHEVWSDTLTRTHWTQTAEGGRRQKAEVVWWPWIEGKRTCWCCCGPWPTSALQGPGSGPCEGLQGGGGGPRGWRDRTPMEFRWGAPNEGGCGTSSFCWRSTPGRTCSTSER